MAHTYTATVEWLRGDQEFPGNKYSRAHTWSFDGGVTVAGSSAPSSVPLPYSKAEAIDPEEALVAALSSCHMLFFLALAAKKGFTVDRYADAAVGEMTKNERGKFFISKVTLAPSITFSGTKKPTAEDIAALHHRAHEECYIANSLRADVVIADIAPIFA
ncbi:MAG: OsmC family protein [Proteobacteria bacterium]|nr:OsmC family protein [Pseudomonadota bacterium]